MMKHIIINIIRTTGPRASQTVLYSFSDKLDGIRPRGTKRKSHNSPLAEDFDDDPYDEREEDMRLGKKRVS